MIFVHGMAAGMASFEDGPTLVLLLSYPADWGSCAACVGLNFTSNKIHPTRFSHIQSLLADTRRDFNPDTSCCMNRNRHLSCCMPCDHIVHQSLAQVLVLLEVPHVEDGHAPGSRHCLTTNEI